MTYWLVFSCGMIAGAIVLGLVIAPALERSESRYRAGRKGAIEDARTGLVPGLEPTPVAKIIKLPREAA